MLSLLFNILLLTKSIYGDKICNNQYNGTTQNFQDIFLGRCFNYINLIHQDNCEIKSANLNCSLIWEEFSKVIIKKSPCQVTIQDFDKFVNLTSHPYPNDRSVFWSGTYKPVHKSKLIDKIYFSFYFFLLLFNLSRKIER